MVMAPAEQRQQEQLFHATAMRDRSTGKAQLHLPVPSIPPQPDLITCFMQYNSPWNREENMLVAIPPGCLSLQISAQNQLRR